MLSQAACQPSDVHNVKTKLDDSAKILNTAAHANHDLYQSGTYGPVGSPQAIKIRQDVAKVVGEANDALIGALTVAKTLTAANVGTGKAQILAELQAAVTALSSVGIVDDKIKVALQAAALLINDAVILVAAMKG